MLNIVMIIVGIIIGLAAALCYATLWATPVEDHIEHPEVGPLDGIDTEFP